MEEVYTQLGALLGMAVDGTDAVGQWLPTAISQYATMKVMSGIPWLGLFTSASIVCVIVLALAVREVFKQRKAYEDAKKKNSYVSIYDYVKDFDEIIIAVFTIALALALFCDAVVISATVRWVTAPDASLLRELLHTLGGK